MVKPVKLKARRKAQNSSSVLPVRMLSGLRQGFFYSLPYILSLTAVGLLFGTVIAYALNSSTFQLTQVRILNAGPMNQAQAFDFCELRKGESLIHLDLVGVQEVIKRKHPEYKEVRVRRVLPNELEVVLKRRTPVAQVIFSSRYIQVDKDLVLLPGGSAAPFRTLTVVEGLSAPPEGLFVGVVLKNPVMERAIKLADVMRQSGVLRGHALTAVNISDPDNLLLLVDGQIEIRFGGAHYAERFKILEQTLKRVPLDSSKIAYIDLRFDDVVIGPR